MSHLTTLFNKKILIEIIIILLTQCFSWQHTLLLNMLIYLLCIYLLSFLVPCSQYKLLESKDFINSWASIQQMLAKYLLHEQMND